MNIFEILFYLVITGGVAYLVYTSRNSKNSNNNEVDQLKTEKFINTAAEAAAEAASKSVKELETFQELQGKDYELHQEKVGQTLKPVAESVKDLDKRIESLQKEQRGARIA